MKIETLYDLCDAIRDFNDMMESDRYIEQSRAEQMGDPKSVSKMQMLSNLLDEFSDIAEYAKRFCENL